MKSFKCAAIAILGLTPLLTPPVGQDENPIQPMAVQLDRPVSFDGDVLPILRANCIACHNKTNNENELVLETVADIAKGGSEGPSVVSGKPDDSLLYKVAARTAEPVMPPLPNDAKAKALTRRELGMLRQWIIEGAKASPKGSARKMAWRPVSDRLKAVHCVGYHEPTGTIAASRGSRIDLYDLHRRRKIGSLVDSRLGSDVAHRDIVQSIAVHPTDAVIATGGYRTVKFWKQASPAAASRAFEKVIQTYAVDPSGRVAVAFGTEVQVFDSLDAANPLASLKDVGSVTALVFDPDGDLLIGTNAGVLRRWRQEAGNTVLGPTVDTASPITCLAAVSGLTAVGTAAGSVFLTADGKITAEMKEHVGKVDCLRFNGGKQLLSADEAGTVLQWDVATGKVIRTLKGTGPISAIAVSPDSLHVAVATAQGVVIWNLQSGKQVAVGNVDFKHARRLAGAEFAQQVQERKVNDRTKKVSAAKAEVDTQTKTLGVAKQSGEKATKAAKDATEKKVAEDQKVDAARKALAAKPTDKGLKSKLDALVKSQAKLAEAAAKAVGTRDAATKDISIVQQSLSRATGTYKRQLTLLAEMVASRDAGNVRLAELKKLRSKLSRPVSVRFDSTSLLTSIDATGQVRTWQATTGKPLSVLGEARPVSSAVVAGGGFLAVDDMRKTLTRHSPVPQWVRRGEPLPVDQIVGRVRALAFSNDGRLFAVGSGQPSRSGQLQIRDTKTRRLLHEIKDAHSDTVLDVEFSPDNRLLLSCGSDKFAKAWNVSDGSFVQSYEGHTHHVLAATWQADMTRVATGSGDNQIKVWDAETGEQRRTITTHSKDVTGLRFVGSAENLISCSGDRTIRNFTASNGRQVRSYGGATDYLHGVVASAAGEVVIAGSEDGVLSVWNGSDGKLLFRFPGK